MKNTQLKKFAKQPLELKVLYASIFLGGAILAYLGR